MLTITVIGTPAPQGSKKHVGNGILVESSKAVKPWRQAVVYAAREARGDTAPLEGPVHVEMTFTLRRPKTAKLGARPAKRPDLSKLIRSTEDALTDAGVWMDDAQVVSVEAMKVYTGHPLALDVPGARIVVSPLSPIQKKESMTSAARLARARIPFDLAYYIAQVFYPSGFRPVCVAEGRGLEGNGEKLAPQDAEEGIPYESTG